MGPPWFVRGSSGYTDLAAEGQIFEAVLVYAPDRLSRKYAYQILLIEELARHGVDTVFMQAPQAATAEDQLLVQFQGMIAEYERAQILERSRRGKRHRARQGQVNVLSGAPFTAIVMSARAMTQPPAMKLTTLKRISSVPSMTTTLVQA